MSIDANQVRAWGPAALACVAVVAFAAGSSSLSSAKAAGGPGRWAVLFALCIVALVEAVPRLRQAGMPHGLTRFLWLPLAFIGLCFLSVAWSPAPRLTFERTVSLAVLFLTAAALAVVVAADVAAMRRLFAGLVLGATIVALVGFAMLAAGVSAAAQPRNTDAPWRYRGFGENPNTVAVLAAVVLPLVTWLGLTARDRRARAYCAIAFLALLASTIASGSRGGQIASLIGVEIVFATTIRRWHRRFAVGLACAIVLFAGIAVREVTQPAAPSFYSAIPKPPSRAVVAGNLQKGPPMQPLPPRDSEIGHPLLSRAGTTSVGSGRLAVWIGTMKDVVLERPLLGYGFGTEERVFVDRWYNFQGGTPENSVIGLLLQLGFIGLFLMVALVAVVMVGAYRALRSSSPPTRVAAGVGLAVLAAGLALAFFQAYVYSVGNVATLTVWIVMFIAAASSLGAPRAVRGAA